MKYFFNLKECFSILIYLKIWFIYVMQSWIFSIINPVFIAWSFRNNSNICNLSKIWFIIKIGNRCAAYFIFFIYFWNPILLWGSLINKKIKRTAFIQIRCFLTISMFTITVSSNLANICWMKTNFLIYIYIYIYILIARLSWVNLRLIAIFYLF